MPELTEARPQTALARTITLIAGAVLIATQTIAASVAGGWAIAGFLGLGTYVEYALMAVGLALGVWAVVAFVRSATKNDPARG